MTVQFQSTHPRRVWQSVEHWATPYGSFNPHTHEGCDNPVFDRFCIGDVSIHTPTKGVTQVSRRTTPERSFNPHTHEGCDSTSWLRRKRTWSFNPHTHEGCDYRSPWCVLSVDTFQSTHPRRVWPYWEQRTKQRLEFQSTHPRRVWLLVFTILCRKKWSFNPHTHEGCDYQS